MNAPPVPPVDQVDGAGLLNELHEEITRYVILPSPEAADAVTLYIAATHAQGAWEHATRLVIKSPLKRCGKTRLQEVCRETVHQPLPAVNISSAALVRSITEKDPPTLILDEADTVWGKKEQRAENAEDLRGILNSGHSRGWPYVRWNAASREREVCSTFAMAIIGGIGDMPDTIEDRAVVVSMRRRAPGETVTAWRSRRAVPMLRELRDRVHEWVTGELDALAAAEPEVPAEDRAADVWEPLVAVADVAGGDWPARARKACAAMIGSAGPEAGGAEEQILGDLRAVWGAEEELFTTTILERLAKLEESPWPTWHRGDPLSARALSALLRPYGIRSCNVRTAAGQAKGYRRADLVDAWARYVDTAARHDPDAQPSQPSQPSQTSESAGQPGDGLWDGNGENIRPNNRPAPEQAKQGPRDGGTDGTDDRLDCDDPPQGCQVCGQPEGDNHYRDHGHLMVTTARTEEP